MTVFKFLMKLKISSNKKKLSWLNNNRIRLIGDASFFLQNKFNNNTNNNN